LELKKQKPMNSTKGRMKVNGLSAVSKEEAGLFARPLAIPMDARVK
jgi:hypothetical protein